MKIKDGYLLREVAGSFIVVPVGNGAIDFSGVISLNSVGAFLWGKMESGATKKELLEAVLNEYDVEKSVAEADIDEFVEKLKGADLLEN